MRRISTAAYLTGVSARRTHEPIGHRPKVPHECPECRRMLSEGYSCPECADLRKLYCLAVPKPQTF